MGSPAAPRGPDPIRLRRILMHTFARLDCISLCVQMERQRWVECVMMYAYRIHCIECRSRVRMRLMYMRCTCACMQFVPECVISSVKMYVIVTLPPLASPFMTSRATTASAFLFSLCSFSLVCSLNSLHVPFAPCNPAWYAPCAPRMFLVLFACRPDLQLRMGSAVLGQFDSPLVQLSVVMALLERTSLAARAAPPTPLGSDGIRLG
jgi:hypothetical protein